MGLLAFLVFCGRQGVPPGNGRGQLSGLMSGREGRCLTDGSGDVAAQRAVASSGRSGDRAPERGDADRVNLAMSPQGGASGDQSGRDERSPLIGGASSGEKSERPGGPPETRIGRRVQGPEYAACGHSRAYANVAAGVAQLARSETAQPEDG